MGTRRRANYYIQYTARDRFPFDIYVYRGGLAALDR